MTNRQAITILRIMIMEKRGAVKGVDRFRWPKDQKDLARKVLREDVDALALAVKALRS